MTSAKLGYLISQYPAVNHTFILREVIALRRAGIDVRTVSIRPADRAISQLSADEAVECRQTFHILEAGIAAVLASHARTFVRHPIRYLRTLWYSWELARCGPRQLVAYTAYFLEAVVAGDQFEHGGVSLVHSHFASTVALIMARLFPIRISLTIHGPSEFNDVVGFHMAEKVAAAQFIATISRYGASQVMVASDPVHWSKVRCLPLGVDPEDFRPRPREDRTQSSPFRLIFVGRLAPVKAQLVLLEAVCLLRARGRAVQLTLVGDGPSRQVLEREIRDRGIVSLVTLAGACNHDRIADFYRVSDAFVLASFAEGVPIVLMEAMASGLPCIATWITGIPELIDQGVSGLLVPPASPGEIADAVERLMDDPALAQNIASQGRDKVISKYDLTRKTQRLQQVFEEHLSSARVG